MCLLQSLQIRLRQMRFSYLIRVAAAISEAVYVYIHLGYSALLLCQEVYAKYLCGHFLQPQTRVLQYNALLPHNHYRCRSPS